jgi:hypothetical protein
VKKLLAIFTFKVNFKLKSTSNPQKLAIFIPENVDSFYGNHLKPILNVFFEHSIFPLSPKLDKSTLDKEAFFYKKESLI